MHGIIATRVATLGRSTPRRVRSSTCERGRRAMAHPRPYAGWQTRGRYPPGPGTAPRRRRSAEPYMGHQRWRQHGDAVPANDPGKAEQIKVGYGPLAFQLIGTIRGLIAGRQTGVVTCRHRAIPITTSYRSITFCNSQGLAYAIACRRRRDPFRVTDRNAVNETTPFVARPCATGTWIRGWTSHSDDLRCLTSQQYFVTVRRFEGVRGALGDTQGSENSVASLRMRSSAH